ncbi:MAG: 50S ribosomal protein L11 [Sedimentisphaerales bacterium]|nr:50S ribosomal protein L11 [Sedimentisphaerales bacterium]
MAKKQITAQVKVQAPGGKATPAPPIGPALGQHGINIGQFVSQFNDRTKEFNGMIIPCIITVYSDRSFDFVLKSPPTSVLLKKAANIAQGSGEPNSNKVGKVNMAQVNEIAKTKMEDMNCGKMESAIKMIAGTARSMGIEVVD